MTMSFWQKVDQSGGSAGCWPWLGYRNSRGYGRVTIGQRTRQAHRVAYELAVGPIPEGLTLDHLCRNRGCVNPSHLEPVTNRENVLRGFGITAIEAKATHCSRGHEYTPENTMIRNPGYRACRACKAETNRAYYAANAERERQRARARYYGLAALEETP